MSRSNAGGSTVIAFVIQRLIQAVLVMLVVGLISFSLFQFVGDPVNNMVGQEATVEQREALARAAWPE